MSTISLDKLIEKARKLDEGIRELEEEWRFPGAFVGGHENVTEKTEHYVEELMKSLQKTQDDINKMMKDLNISEEDPTNDEVDTFLQEARDVYNTMKTDVDNLETVFQEYGYHYDKDQCSEATATLKLEEIDTKNDSNNSNNKEEEEEEEVVFTPYLSWRKKKLTDKTSLSVSENESLSKKSELLKVMADLNLESKKKERAYGTNDRLLLSAKKEEEKSGESLLMCKQGLTPLRDRPQCQIYSRHFYDLIKKKAKE
ncbi:PREDICTED: uncharacterized protein LOC107065312 [Polistes dominula]|uniref:Uncharacterized protein LOC107065312 n=1 Tax=Polistes dominula TaxID=743375 RepID=A0ABM1I2E9_POLDO|nr:PREDICTED: uncharacterized protein LOC107065312 [Polistes dominula]XP_015174386.1 PREDICTED: uncharacterized protein LOC107065312 [Polistes dominula]